MFLMHSKKFWVDFLKEMLILSICLTVSRPSDIFTIPNAAFTVQTFGFFSRLYFLISDHLTFLLESGLFLKEIVVFYFLFNIFCP